MGLIGGAQPTKLRSGDPAATEHRVERWTDELEDRFTLQHCVRWPDRASVERKLATVRGNPEGLSFAVEPLSWCVAHKLDAVFKPRSKDWVSSRCRDLFDIALLHERQLELDSRNLMSHFAALGALWEIEPSPPPEWSVAWSKLTDDSGYHDLEIEYAWHVAQALARLAKEKRSR